MKGVFCTRHAHKNGMCKWHLTQTMTKTTTVAAAQVAPLTMMPRTTNANATALAANDKDAESGQHTRWSQRPDYRRTNDNTGSQTLRGR